MKKPQLLQDARFGSSNLYRTHDWSWLSGNSDTANEPANYYEASLSPWEKLGSLENDDVCDVVVVGGGLLGTSSALHLSEAGLETVLLEKSSIGSSASGRNGGQLTPGLARWEAETMIDNLVYEEAKRLWNFTSCEAIDLIKEISARYEFDTEYSSGHLTAAIHQGHLSSLTESVDARHYLGDRSANILGRHMIRSLVNSPLYHGGVLDTLGGQIHPLALNRGMCFGIYTQGGRVYENSEVIGLTETSKGTLVETKKGNILARKAVVIAVHNHTFRLFPEAGKTTIPFYSYIGVTKPLSSDIATILPGGCAVYDTQLQIDYYRAVRKNRVLFGGQGTGHRWQPEEAINYLGKRLHNVFPQCKGLEFESVWSGSTDFTLNGATDCRKFGNKNSHYLVHGWSGHGVAQTVRIGKAISDDITGSNKDFEMLMAIEHAGILLGRQLSPMVIPMAKTMLEMGSAIVPGKLISF
ncbi:NAD(P)/FAD-dependent oxidoreductase [Serratia marcescens]|uniref:NAD(P)/FAD-dependent oxidoreductase n=1 Tax=Serratia marcescens TaxID=615 RepID=UPI003FA74A12